MRKAMLIDGFRTPFTRAHKGALAGTRPDDLLSQLLRHGQRRFDPHLLAQVEDIIVGCAYPEGEQGYNVARCAALGAGMALPGMVVSRLCASSLDALAIAAARIRGGFGRAYLVAGVESMSRVKRRGATFSPSPGIRAAAPEAYVQMGITAENLATRLRFDRSQQEALAAESHARAHTAWEAGAYASTVVSLSELGVAAAPETKPAAQVAGAAATGTDAHRDESVRFPVDMEKVRSLPPAFREGGTVTAATSSPLSDGAALALVVDAALVPADMACTEVVDATFAAVAPDVMGLGPIDAIAELHRRHGAPDIWEINEAFSTQMLATLEGLKLPDDRVNAWGGALAVGHPLGASGLRLALTAHARLALGESAIAALCVGGGQGVALYLKRDT